VRGETRGRISWQHRQLFKALIGADQGARLWRRGGYPPRSICAIGLREREAVPFLAAS